MTKKTSVTIVSLALLFIGVAAYFIFTFDLNRYHVRFVSEVEKFLGNPVEAGPLSLSFNRGIALKMGHLNVYPDKNHSENAVLQISSIQATLDPTQLLRQKIQIASVAVDQPKFHVIRMPDSTIRLLGFSPASAEKKSEDDKVGFSLLIDRLDVRDGQMRLTDNLVTPPLQIEARAIDFAVRDLGFLKPVQLDVKLGILSEKQNVSVHGSLKIPIDGQPFEIQNAEILVDLSQMNLTELNRLLAQMGFPIFENSLQGKLFANLTHLKIASGSPIEPEVTIRLSDARVTLNQVPASFEEISCFGHWSGAGLQVENCAAHFSDGALQLKLTIPPSHLKQPAAVSFSAEKLNVAQLLPPNERQSTPSIKGEANLFLNGNFLPADAQTSISGQGELVLKDGVLVNFNLLREVFSTISIIPGLSRKLEERLPEEERQRIEIRDTALGVVKVPFVMDRFGIQYQNLEIVTPDFSFVSSGRINWNKSLAIQGMLKIGPGFSDALVRSVSELSTFLDEEGRLTLPVDISGSFSKPVVMPNVSAVATQLVVSKAEELLASLLKK